MEVAHRRADVAVSQQTLDGVDINAGFKQVGGESVALMPSSALAPLCRVPDYADQGFV